MPPMIANATSLVIRICTIAVFLSGIGYRLGSISAAVLYNEATSGDLPFDFISAPVLTLQLGSNEVKGNFGLNSDSDQDGDMFRIVVPANRLLSTVGFSATRTVGSLVFANWQVLAPNNQTVLFQGSIPTANQSVLNSLGPGTYTFFNYQFGIARFTTRPAFANYTLDFTLVKAPGSAQDAPILPSSQPNGTFVFIGVPSGSWFDPPLVEGFHYEMTTPGSLFTGITGFPTGFSGPFTVSSGGTVLGQFVPGQALMFPGGGVSSFDVTGITPLADAASPTAFPLQLTFSTPTASFTMQGIEPVPEPGTFFAWAGLALAALAGSVRASVGEKVRVVRGLLAGLVGTVREWTAESRCVLEVEGLPDGVWLVVEGHALEGQARD